MRRALALFALACLFAACDDTPPTLTLGAFEDGRASPGGLLLLRFFDVGHSEATLVRSPSGHAVLIGAGGAGGRADLAREVGGDVRGRLDLYAPFSPDPVGLAALKRAMKVRQHLALDDWRDSDIPRVALGDEGRVALGGGVWLEPIHASDGETIVGHRIEHDTVSFVVLSSGDFGEAKLPSAIRPASLLRAPVGGTAGSIDARVLEALSPRAVLISVGAGNDEEAPAQVVLEALNRTGARVFRTDLDGTVSCESDGKRVECAPARKAAGEQAPEVFVHPPLEPAQAPGPAPAPDDTASAEAPESEPPAPARSPTSRASYLARQGETHFHMANCRSVRALAPEQLRAFTTRADAARRLRAAPDCNP